MAKPAFFFRANVDVIGQLEAILGYWVVEDGTRGSYCSINQGDLLGLEKPDRSQSYHSSQEVTNHHGAKGNRKVDVIYLDARSTN